MLDGTGQAPGMDELRRCELRAGLLEASGGFHALVRMPMWRNGDATLAPFRTRLEVDLKSTRVNRRGLVPLKVTLGQASAWPGTPPSHPWFAVGDLEFLLETLVPPSGNQGGYEVFFLPGVARTTESSVGASCPPAIVGW